MGSGDESEECRKGSEDAASGAGGMAWWGNGTCVLGFGGSGTCGRAGELRSNLCFLGGGAAASQGAVHALLLLPATMSPHLSLEGASGPAAATQPREVPACIAHQPRV